jgi:hypothetical protein
VTTEDSVPLPKAWYCGVPRKLDSTLCLSFDKRTSQRFHRPGTVVDTQELGGCTPARRTVAAATSKPPPRHGPRGQSQPGTLRTHFTAWEPMQRVELGHEWGGGGLACRPRHVGLDDEKGGRAQKLAEAMVQAA